MVGNGGDCYYFRWFGRRVGIGDEDVLILGGCHVQCCSRNTISGYLIFISYVCGFYLSVDLRCLYHSRIFTP